MVRAAHNQMACTAQVALPGLKRTCVSQDFLKSAVNAYQESQGQSHSGQQNAGNNQVLRTLYLPQLWTPLTSTMPKHAVFPLNLYRTMCYWMADDRPEVTLA